ncbi:MAG: hypothetical protein ACFFEY_16085 [Candidatus Thorarchaeota archaeon]
MSVEKSLKQFRKDIVEEIEYEWDSEKIFIENYKIFYIDTSNTQIKEIKDDKTLNIVRRNEKIFIILLDKNLKFSTIKDIPLLDKWYKENLMKYQS